MSSCLHEVLYTGSFFEMKKNHPDATFIGVKSGLSGSCWGTFGLYGPPVGYFESLLVHLGVTFRSLIFSL